MKRIAWVLILSVVLFSCSDDDEDEGNSYDNDFKQEMRNFVIGISTYAKSINSDFIICKCFNRFKY